MSVSNFLGVFKGAEMFGCFYWPWPHETDQYFRLVRLSVSVCQTNNNAL